MEGCYASYNLHPGGDIRLFFRLTPKGQSQVELARKAFTHTAAYDSAISAFLSHQDAENVPSTYELA